MPTEHAQFGSSTAKRTNNCPAWVELSKGIPNHESQAAADGTAVHSIIEVMLLDGEFTDKADPDHLELAEDLMEAIDASMNAHNITDYEPECRGTVAEDVFGTIDFLGVTADGVGVIADVKSGRGVQVDAVGNDQLLFAAWAALNESSGKDLIEKCEKFIGIIWQPGRDGTIHIKEWEFTRAEVDRWGAFHVEQIAKARKGGQTPNPGDHCAFCSAAFKCPAKTGDALRALQFDPADLTIIGENMDRVEELKAWCKDVEKAAYNALEVGQDVKGWKLVASRATRKWKDEAAAIKALRRKLGGVKAITVTKLLGIGAVEKAIKKADLDLDIDEMGLTVKESSGSTTLAPESDKRPAVLSAEAFGAALASVK